VAGFGVANSLHIWFVVGIELLHQLFSLLLSVAKSARPMGSYGPHGKFAVLVFFE
jgi:hypothetical protein